MCRETPPARSECLPDLEHSFGTGAGRTENISTVPTWDGIYRDALSENRAHFDSGAAVDGWEGFSEFERPYKAYGVFDEFLWLL